ncbi:PDZ domain-containing protein [Flavobacterium sp.]|uniref:PDZ domain-containing protein n=1 Tax=Flavobacterium sp. TaxID=239 RepID=UPI0028BD5678|nr:PDZ domain-containing protein [Flavobacterium sp.]
MRIGYLLLFVFLTIQAFSQKGFQWESKKDKIVIPFTFVDNLIIIPIEINNTKLNMLLDSGSEPSLLFSFPENDSINLYNTRKIKISGLGNEEMAEGIFSENNIAKVTDGYVNKEFDLLIILDEKLNFSSRIGIPVNGILGYSFFSNHVVKIDYGAKKITLYKDKKILDSSKLKTFTKFPISITKGRPYLDVKIKLDDKEHALKLLIDTGLGDGLWLFENDSIQSNKNYFNDVLGEGIGGTVLGKKSRLDEIQFSKFKLNSPLVSYPDTTSYKQLRLINNRNGSVGSEILKRFTIFFDFEGSQIMLKKNNYFHEPFNYNMSGLEIQHAGVEWVSEGIDKDELNKQGLSKSDIAFETGNFKYKFVLKPIFEIAAMRKDSPAELAGLKVGDLVLRIDGKNVQNLTKQKITELLQSEDGKTIIIEIERKGVRKKFEFQLKKLL